jgi:hypothetical protein
MSISLEIFCSKRSLHSTGIFFSFDIMNLSFVSSMALAALMPSVMAIHSHFLHDYHGDHQHDGTNYPSGVTTSPSGISSSPYQYAGSSVTPAPTASAKLSTRDNSSSSNFVHPGIFLSSAQLSFVSSKVAASAEPWATAYEAMMDHELATRTSPTPYATVSSDASSDAELDDALAAYLNALSWIVTGAQSYAERAIDFMNGWSSTIQTHEGSNAPLQAGWAASTWTRTAEIIRYTDAGWGDSDISAFEEMLRDVYLPEVIVGSNYNGNWELGALIPG